MAKAVSITRREFAELVDVAPAGAPADHEVVGRTLYTLISPGTELAWNYTGENFPTFPGYAATYEVTQVGASVTDIKAGDIVFARGGHRSDSKIAAADAVVLPSGCLAAVGVVARLMGVSMTTLSTTKARPGNNVVVTGLGPVGYLAAHLFRRAGYRVVAVDPIAARREIATESGLPVVVDRIPEGLPELALVVECSGHEQAVVDACRAVRRLGEVVMVGVPWKKMTDLSAFDVLHAVFHKYAILRSGWEWEIPEHPNAISTQSLHGNYQTAIDWLTEGSIPVERYLVKNRPENAQAVYQALLARKSDGLFQLFDWT